MTARSWLVSYVCLAGIWGFSFAFNKTALTALSPLGVTVGRMGLGALTLILFLAARGALPRPSRHELRDLVIVGTVGLALPFTLIAFAQTRVTSIVAGLLNAATPLFTGLFVALLLPNERPDRRQVAGLLVGFAGIAVLIGAWNLRDAGAVDPLGALAMMGATTCYGFSTSFSRVSLSSSALSGAQLAAPQLLSGFLLCLLLVPLDPSTGSGIGSTGSGVDGGMTLAAALSVAALGILGTGVAMVLFWHIIRVAGSTIAATVTYVVPVV